MKCFVDNETSPDFTCSFQSFENRTTKSLSVIATDTIIIIDKSVTTRRWKQRKSGENSKEDRGRRQDFDLMRHSEVCPLLPSVGSRGS